MNATLTADGKLDLPPALREQAHLHPGDTLEVHFYKGTVLLRKHAPLTPEECAALLERSRSQPKPADEDDAAVAETIRAVRAVRR
jgi:bifunctional DNA-binding transcriptional regulator/antitoxin component of YhaV-PrlF toxin-antitoxin module